MVKKVLYSIVLICFVIAMCGCSNMKVSADGSYSAKNLTAVPDAGKSQVIQKAFFNERLVNPDPHIPSGIVYKGYLYSAYDLIYGPIGPISLEKVCKLLEIKMTPEDSMTKAEFMDKTQGSWSPFTIHIERGNAKLDLKVVGLRDEYYKNNAYPSVLYKAFKAGREISFKNISAYKGTIYISSLEELLSALGVKYYVEKETGSIFVDSDNKTGITGRVL